MVTTYGADVIELQEIRWKGSGVLSGKKSEADVYHSCQQNRQEFGCDFAVGCRGLVIPHPKIHKATWILSREIKTRSTTQLLTHFKRFRCQHFPAANVDY